MDISLIEFIVYGIVGYTGIVLLIASAFRDTPTSKSQSIVRAMYLSISVIAIMVLSGSGLNITTDYHDSTVTEYVINGTSGDNITNSTISTNSTNKYILNNPVWIPFHYMLAVVMLVYVILQILTLFTKV